MSFFSFTSVFSSLTFDRKNVSFFGVHALIIKVQAAANNYSEISTNIYIMCRNNSDRIENNV